MPEGLGVGVVWWPPLDDLCRPGEGLVDVIEVEPEAFWVPNPGGSGFRSTLPGAVAHLPQPKLLHGVGAPLADPCPPPAGHAEALAREVAGLRPRHVSEHLNVTRFRPASKADPIFAGFMLPPRQSPAGVALAAANIRRHRATACGDAPFAVETPVNYLPPLPDEIADGEFVATVAEAADCGILLDLHNVLCNARNGRQSVTDFIAALPLDRVWEVHLAGGESVSGFWVDSHSGLAEPELVEIAAELLPRLPRLQAIVFEILPERIAKAGLAAIARQLAQLHELWDTRGHDARPSPRSPDPVLDDAPPDPEQWTRLLGAAVTGHEHPATDETAWWQSSRRALDLYRSLIADARASMVAAAAPQTTRLLLRQKGGAETRRLLAEFWRETPQGYTMADEARAFLRFLEAAEPTLPGRGAATVQDLALMAV
ncbi:MAG TPA: DUF692 family protein [Stellaceae bacterium]